jgi:hypothetical protein
MRNPLLYIFVIGSLLRVAGRLLKVRLELPDWSANEAYLTKLQAWRRQR